MEKTRAKHKKGARKWAFPLGLLIAVLALVGVVTVLVAGVSAIRGVVEKSRNFDEYNTLLAPVVMNDPAAFDDLTQADPEQLLDITIWSILRSGLSPDQYDYDDNGMVIPEADVTAEFVRLFGTEVAPQHGTVEGYGYTFAYDATQQTYSIPLTGVVPTYTPRVVDKDTRGDTIVLTVGYIGGDQWAQDEQGNMVAPEPDKYMRVTLREGENGYYISALQNTAAPETATTAAPNGKGEFHDRPHFPLHSVRRLRAAFRSACAPDGGGRGYGAHRRHGRALCAEHHARRAGCALPAGFDHAALRRAFDDSGPAFFH